MSTPLNGITKTGMSEWYGLRWRRRMVQVEGEKTGMSGWYGLRGRRRMVQVEGEVER